MILTDREIQIALQQKHVTIDPPPTPDAYASTSVDLTLGRTFAVWEAQEGGPIRPGTPGFKYTNFIRNQKIEEKDVHFLKHGELVLAWTREVVALPVHSRIAARVEGKSSLARLGIGVHLTAPTIHCGFSGPTSLRFSISDLTRSSWMPACASANSSSS